MVDEAIRYASSRQTEKRTGSCALRAETVRPLRRLPIHRAARPRGRASASVAEVMVVVMMMVVMVRDDLPDDATDDPVMVVVVVMMVAVMMVVITRDLRVAIQPADRLALRLARGRRIGRPQRRHGVGNRVEQLGE